MTIAAGFRCSDGVVLAADTEHTRVAKFQRPKLWWLKKGDTSVMVTGAGPATWLGFVRDHVFRGLKPSMAAADVSDLIYQILSGLFRDHIDGRDLGMESVPSFIFAVKKGQQYSLYETEGSPAPSLVPTWTCIGAGGDLGGYLADLLYQRDLTVAATERLAAYLIYQAKQHSAFCGGSTDVVSLTRQAEAEHVPYATVREWERWFATAHGGFGHLLLTGLQAQLTDDAVQQETERFRRWLLASRRAAHKQREARDAEVEALLALEGGRPDDESRQESTQPPTPSRRRPATQPRSRRTTRDR